MNTHSISKPKAGRPRSSGAEVKVFSQKASKAFGQAVREIRREHSVSQEDLAYISGIERSHMGKIERGETMPSIVTTLRVTKALGISASVLMLETERILQKLEEEPGQGRRQ